MCDLIAQLVEQRTGNAEEWFLISLLKKQWRFFCQMILQGILTPRVQSKTRAGKLSR